MSRYLTPGKITLLVVAFLYASDLVPIKEAAAVLSFILSHSVPSQKPLSSLQSDQGVEHALPISAFEAALSPLPSAQPGRTLYDLLLKRIWAIDCSHALEAFIANLPIHLRKSREQILLERETGEEFFQNNGRILGTSPLGSFIRRCYLEYIRLQFQDSIILWQDFVSYRLPTRQAYEKKNYAEDENALDSNLADMNLDSSHALTQIMYGRLAEEEQQQRGAYSMYDVEKLMEFQASELQRLGGRLPDGMKAVLHQISRAGTTIPKMAHYLNFLDCWRAGDYHSAYDNIHRYFDFAMQTQDRSFYQYALLNLAILQADAGCPAQALPAMQEAIAAARENKDTTCLNFCMSWVYHFARSFPGKMDAIRDSGILGNEIEGLAFLKTRARDAEMWSLLSTTFLGEAKLGLQYGDSIAGVFENLAKASHINIVRSTQRLSGATLLMKGPAFGRVGLAHIGWWYSQIFMQCHSKDASLEDVMKCTCRLASLLVQRGRYDEAGEMLNNVPPPMLRVVKFQNYISLYGGLLRVRRFLHRGNYDGAERLLRRLRGRASPDVELRFSLSMFEVELMLRRGLLEEALQKIEDLSQTAVKNQEINDITVQMRLLNLKTRVLIQSGKSLKAFSLITRAIRIAHRARHLGAMWESIGLLATILNELREFAAAADLMQSIMPRVLECHDCGLAARSYSVLAEANMGLAGLETDESTRQKELLGRVIEHLDRACTQFGHLEDVRCQLGLLKKKATIMHWKGDLVLANDTATQYLGLLKEYEAQTDWTE
ncbi:hypothetical protein G647_10255 [Cladophialophora carrionii CBS 160.54]|uniref:Anaphase-promoting complex subunit 5 n=1 Tax=Cladophialophora carrionii CBS 160.54 TaxID=1279043 RepID=V9DIW3_9EURO|nr:uncharacterized protein G647_10255 [Cladophialophora carrionii CBS 160.54]ETI26810.1 hypothetical protein G647_10255 [Cladophialophora carrionii CBS 160.54]